MKIKRILVLSLVVILSLACATILFACNDDNGGGGGGHQSINPDEIPDYCEHKWIVEETQPTCTNCGYKTTVCELCGKMKSTEEIPVLGHELIDHEGKLANCEEGGWKSYKTCSRCSYTTYQEILPTKHLPTYVPVKFATCTESGHSSYEQCVRCGKILTEEYEIYEKLGHELTHHERKESTCTEIGWEEYDTCSRCDYTTYKEIEPYHHYDADDYCVDCGQAKCAEYLELKLNTAKTAYSITNFKDGVPANLVIPEKNKGLPITTIEKEAFKNCLALESVTIGKNIETIGMRAFYQCTNLTNVVLNDSSIIIDNTAFSECENLAYTEYDNAYYLGDGVNPHLFLMKAKDLSITSCEIHPNTKVIFQYAFSGCSGLTSITIPDSVTSICKGAFYGAGLTSVVIPDSVTSIESQTFIGCSSLVDIVIPDSVTSIRKDAFSSCCFINYQGPVIGIDKFIKSNLETVVLNGGGSIPNSAFYRCSTLTSVTIGDGVTSIGEQAFSGCKGLTEVTIGNGVTSIGKSAFSSCDGLTTITIGNGVTNVDYAAFYGCSALSTVNITDIAAWCGVSIYNDTASPFYNSATLCDNGESIENLVIPDDVTSIGQYAFYRCSGLQSVTIGNGVKSIGQYAFYGCKGLTSIDIPDNVTSIDWYAFSYCSNLSSVTIGNGVTNVGGYAFYYCVELASLTIGNSVENIGRYAFANCGKLESVAIPSSVIKIGTYAFYNCTNLKEVFITDLTAWFNVQFESFAANPLYYADNLYLNGELVEDLIVPDGVTEIYDNAFYDCESIKTITIPDGVKSIGYTAFSDCKNVTKVTIPSSLTSIATSAFSDCKNLTGVYIEDISAWCNIEFGNNYSNPLHYGGNLYLNGVLVTDLVIPEGVTEIKDYAFCYYGSLTSVTIGSDVTKIGKESFCRCDNLESVTMGENVEKIGSNAFGTCSKLTDVYIEDISAWCNIEFGNSSSNPLHHGGNLYLNGVLVTDLTIPDDVTNICDYAFYGCTSIYSVAISEGVETIGQSAFSFCGELKVVAIPSTLTYVGHSTFYQCNKLTAVYITDLVAWCNIYFYSYYANPLYYAHNLYLNNVLVTDLVIPAEVTSICDFAFYSCTSLTSVAIPAGLTNIRSEAFADCTGLNAVYITDLESWNNVKFGNGNSNPLNYAHNLYLNGELVQ